MVHTLITCRSPLQCRPRAYALFALLLHVRALFVCRYGDAFIFNCELVISKSLNNGCPMSLLRKYVRIFFSNKSMTVMKFGQSFDFTFFHLKIIIVLSFIFPFPICKQHQEKMTSQSIYSNSSLLLLSTYSAISVYICNYCACPCIQFVLHH